MKRLVAASIAVAVVAFAAFQAAAHEGHAPLPSKGALVDAANGTIVLSRDAHDALRVETAEVVRQKLTTKSLAYAELVSPWGHHAFAASGVSGRVSAVYVKPGDKVHAGQKLAEIESLALGTIQSEFLAAQAEHALAEKLFENAKVLAEQQTVAMRSMREARARDEQSRGAVAVAVSKLRALGLAEEDLRRLLEKQQGGLLERLPITSPIAGTVIHVDVTVGNPVMANTHLFEVVDFSTMWVKIGVLERNILSTKVGQPVELTLSAYPQAMVPTAVSVKGLWLDPRTHVGTMWGEIQNPSSAQPRYLPGMNGEARILESSDQPVLAVPASALVNNGVGRYVIVEEAATAKAFEYRTRDVVVLGESDGVVAIKEGDVYPGDRVVTKGSHELGAFFISGVLRLSPAGEADFGLDVAPARLKTIDNVVELDGAVEVPPEGRVDVTSRLEGRLARIHVDRGQRMTAGEVLAEVSSLDFQALQLELIQMASQTRLSHETLGLLRSLDATQSVAGRQVWEVQATYERARGQLESARWKLGNLGLSPVEIDRIAAEGNVMDLLPIRAPIAGSIVRFDKALGQVIGADESLFEIHDLRRVWVQGFLTERDFADLRSGDDNLRARVRFSAAPDVVVNGTIRRRAGVLGAVDRTVPLWVELDSPAGLELQQNMLARVTVVRGTGKATLAVPRSAIVRQGGRSYVFIRGANGAYERRAIETGRADDLHVEVLAGLVVDEPIVVRGAAALQTAFASVR